MGDITYVGVAGWIVFLSRVVVSPMDAGGWVLDAHVVSSVEGGWCGSAPGGFVVRLCMRKQGLSSRGSGSLPVRFYDPALRQEVTSQILAPYLSAMDSDRSDRPPVPIELVGWLRSRPPKAPGPLYLLDLTKYIWRCPSPLLRKASISLYVATWGAS